MPNPIMPSTPGGNSFQDIFGTLSPDQQQNLGKFDNTFYNQNYNAFLNGPNNSGSKDPAANYWDTGGMTAPNALAESLFGDKNTPYNGLNAIGSQYQQPLRDYIQNSDQNFAGEQAANRTTNGGGSKGFGNIFDTIGKAVTSPIRLIDKIPGIGHYLAPLAGAAIGAATGNPEFALLNSAIGSGIGSTADSYATTGKIGPSLLSGAASGLGSYAGGALGAGIGGGDSIFNQTLGDVSGLGKAALGSTTIGPLLGAGAGSGLAANVLGPKVAGTLQPQSTDIQPFQPQRTYNLNRPQSLDNIQGLSPFQQATNVATKGVFGGGNGQQEQNYFLDLINRQLTDGGNQNVNPIENSYLQQLGISGSTNNDILQGISGRRNQAA